MGCAASTAAPQGQLPATAPKEAPSNAAAGATHEAPHTTATHAAQNGHRAPGAGAGGSSGGEHASVPPQVHTSPKDPPHTRLGSAGGVVRVVGGGSGERGGGAGSSRRERSFAVKACCQVFLSYRIAESKEFTLALQGALNAAGYTAFVGEAFLLPGGEWAPEINAAVKDCAVFVPITTPTYGDKAKSLWTYREFSMADNNRKRIIPVHRSGCYPPNVEIESQLTGTQYIDGGGDARGARRELPLDAVVAHVAAELIERMLALEQLEPAVPEADVGVESSRGPGSRAMFDPSAAAPPLGSAATAKAPSMRRVSSYRERGTSIPGIDDAELEALELPEVVLCKMENPQLQLGVDERLEVLDACIEAGRRQAVRATGRQLVMVIGNTGAGKSTLVNYLHGCQMESFRREGTRKKAIRVKLGSEPPELMRIGHTNVSATFMPQVAGGDETLTFADCPGFLDNRGAEINIANAVNIKAAVARADGVRVLIVLNYFSLQADRGRGLRDLACILADLFGDALRVTAHANSVLLGLSRAPRKDDDDDPLDLQHFRELVSDTAGLGDEEGALIRALAARMFVFDPLERGDATWRLRGELLEALRALPPIAEPASCFRTVLTAEDERALRETVRELSARLKAGMEDGAYSAVADALGRLRALEGVENALVTGLLGRARARVIEAATALKDEAVRAAMTRAFGEAERKAAELHAAAEALRGAGRLGEELVSRVEFAAREAAASVARLKADEEERVTMREELRAAQGQREALTRQLERLEEMAAADRERAAAERAALEEERAAAAHARAEMEARFDAQRAQLEARLADASASEADVRRLHAEMAALAGERETSEREAREAFEAREARLREQAEASARRAEEAEREREEVLRRAEADEQEREINAARAEEHRRREEEQSRREAEERSKREAAEERTRRRAAAEKARAAEAEAAEARAARQESEARAASEVAAVVAGEHVRTLEGHGDDVNSVCFSPDGRVVASGSDDKTVRLWDAATGACVRTLEGHGNWVRSVCFSPDGRRLASGSKDRTVRLWDAETGACVKTLEGHGHTVNSVSFSPDGRMVASGSGDRTVRLWDVETGACARTLEGHDDWVWSVCFSPDGKKLASGSSDKTVRLWNAETGACARKLEGHGRWVSSLCFSPDGKQVASGSNDKTVRLWDAETGACVRTLEAHGHWVSSVCFSPDGKQVASGSYDKTVRLWDVATGACVRTLEGHGSWVKSVCFSPDGRTVASGSGDTTVRLWAAAEKARAAEARAARQESEARAASEVAAVVVGEHVRTLKGHSSRVESACFSSDGRRLASGGDDRTVRLWDVETGACVRTLEGHGTWVTSVCFSLDGKQLASGSRDSTVRLWDTATGACVRTLKGHGGFVYTVCFSPDGKQLASGSSDNTVRLWDAATGACVKTLKGHGSDVTSVCFSPDGKQLTSGSRDRTVRLWDTATGACHACVRTLKGHGGFVYTVCFSPDGKQLASGSHDMTVRLWDVKTGACVRTLEGHGNYVMSVCFSPDGKQLASGSFDNTVRLWDAETGACVKTLKGHRSPVMSVCFSPDGQRLASGSGDRTVRLWAAEEDLRMAAALIIQTAYRAHVARKKLWAHRQII